MAKKSSRNTKARIVSAAWKLFYEQGYEETTVEEIIFESETSKGSFYHYFDGKDALLSSLSVLFDAQRHTQRHTHRIGNRKPASDRLRERPLPRKHDNMGRSDRR